MTTAPTTAQIDTIANEWSTAANLFLNAFQSEGSPVIIFAAYTQNDSTVNVIQLPNDPTSDFTSATICRGLVTQYTNIVLRKYTYNFILPSDVTSTTQVSTGFVATSTEQSRINNSSNWVPAP